MMYRIECLAFLWWSLFSFSFAERRAFYVDDDRFYEVESPQSEAKAVRLLAGSIHYSRVVPDLWDDRVARLAAMGLNTVTTYVPWNFHQNVESGPYDFTSPARDFAEFCRIAQKRGMYVILRAGPYMCGEWEFGGLPPYLFSNGSIPIRTYAEPYMSFVSEYWTSLLRHVKETGILFEDGGAVVMVQVENEFGSYGDVSSSSNDKRYMETLVDLARTTLGNGTILFTTDGGNAGFMTRGSLKGSAVLTIGDGCGDPDTTWAAQRTFNPPGMSPFLCGEFYPGWLTHWNTSLANTSSASVQSGLRNQLSAANGTGSVNFYMGHGGTSFGYWSGANGGGGSDYAADITSYDYNAPVSESGSHGIGSDGVDKFVAIRSVLSEYASGALPGEPPKSPQFVGNVPVASYAPLFENLDALTDLRTSVANLSVGVESLGHECFFGFTLYDTTIDLSMYATRKKDNDGESIFRIDIPDVRDRAMVWIDDNFVGSIFRAHPTSLVFDTSTSPKVVRFRVLVENCGRINFSHGMDDERKGIVRGVQINEKNVVGPWDVRCMLGLDGGGDAVQRVSWKPYEDNSDIVGPTLFRGSLVLNTSRSDAFLSDSGYSKGLAWIGAFNLGRFWTASGPQHTLYVPWPATRVGSNNITLLDLEPDSAAVRTTTTDRHFVFSESRGWA